MHLDILRVDLPHLSGDPQTPPASPTLQRSGAEGGSLLRRGRQVVVGVHCTGCCSQYIVLLYSTDRSYQCAVRRDSYQYDGKCVGSVCRTYPPSSWRALFLARSKYTKGWRLLEERRIFLGPDVSFERRTRTASSVYIHACHVCVVRAYVFSYCCCINSVITSFPSAWVYTDTSYQVHILFVRYSTYLL